MMKGGNHGMTDPKEIIRPSAESIERISLVSSATASGTLTSMGVNNTFIDGPVARTPGRSITGPVLTLQFLPKREDQIAGEGDENVAKQTALWQVLQRVQPGDVIAVDARGQTKTGCFGEMLLTYLAAQGGLGIVVDGSIRDSAEATALDIGIWTRGVTPNYATQTTLSPWDFNVPISCGDNTDINLLCLCRPYGHEFAFLKYPQKLGLNNRREFAYLIKKGRA